MGTSSKSLILTVDEASHENSIPMPRCLLHQDLLWYFFNVKLTCDGSQIANVVKLLTLQGKRSKVSCGGGAVTYLVVCCHVPLLWICHEAGNVWRSSVAQDARSST